MSNKRKTKQLNIEISAEIHQELSIYCVMNYTQKKVIVEKAIKEYLAAHNKQQK